MGLSGLEPPTSRLSGVRSNRLSYKPGLNSNGDDETRTHGPFHAMEVLSQLSYAPVTAKANSRICVSLACVLARYLMYDMIYKQA